MLIIGKEKVLGTGLSKKRHSVLKSSSPGTDSGGGGGGVKRW